MDEINKPGQEDEEFHFTSDYQPDTNAFNIGTTPPRTAARFGGLNRRNLVLIIGGLVLLFALYKLIGMLWSLHGRQTPATLEPQPVPQEVTTEPTPVVQAPITPVDTTQQQLSALQADDAATKQQLQTLQNQMSQLNNTLTSMQATLTTLNNQVTALTTTVSQQQAAIIALKGKGVGVTGVIVAAVPRQPFFILAMMPGRAWLLAPDQTTETVSVGDILEGYGKILSIQPTRGIVTTSSGAIIRYRN